MAATSGGGSTPKISPPEADHQDLSRAWYAVLVLMVCYTLSFIDRQILSLLVGPIKHDLQVSDTKIGLLQGLAFAAFYTVLGLPMGRIADRRSRRNLVAVGVFLWSLLTGLSSLAASFWALFATRLGVGVGEATLGPSASSLIADSFPRERLGKALSVYSAGIFIGSGLALIVGGSVAGAVVNRPAVTVPILGTIGSWRLTFLALGIPGILVGLLVYTLREPARRNLLRGTDGQARHLTAVEVFNEVALRWKSFVGLAAGVSAQAVANYGMQAWTPTFFIRVFGWTPARTGLVLGILILTAGCLGMYAGGTLCDRWQRRSIREAPLKVGAISMACAAVCFALAMSYQHIPWVVIWLAPALFFLSMPVGSSFAALQLIFPNQLRGQVSALLLFLINISGLVIGPWAVGFLNDHLGELMVGYSLGITVGVGALISALFYRLTYPPYRMDYARINEEC
jgi:MFS family permease